MDKRSEIPTTEAEINEQANLRERTEDIKKFWVGFTEWRKGRVEEEKKLQEKLKNKMAEDSETFSSPQEEEAMEMLMVFMYGVKLMRDLKPELAQGQAELRVEFDSTGAIFGCNAVRDRSSHELVDVYLSANYLSLLTFKNGVSEATKEWADEMNHTVSSNLTDRCVVEIICAGVEESAHAFFNRYKQGVRLEDAFDQHGERSKDFRNLLKTENYYSASPTYHSSDVERRALSWQREVMKLHFPHWSTKELQGLIDTVVNIRLGKSKRV